MRFLTLVLFTFSLGLAQSTPGLLPLTASGTGIGQTNAFVTTGPWSISVESDDLVVVYLYDATLGKALFAISNNQVINETGTFFLYVNASGGNWTLTAQSTSASSASSPQTTVSPTTPTPSQTSPTTPDATNAGTGSSTATATSGQEAAGTETINEVSQEVLDSWNDHLGYGIVRFPRQAAVLNQEVCDSFSVIFYVQRTFIDAGGPAKDVLNLDPDGDGYACSYNPNEVYEAPVTCAEDRVWRNSFYDSKGQFRSAACIRRQ